MITHRLFRFVVGAIALLAAVVAHAAETVPVGAQPYEMVRSLQLLQWQMSQGNSQAHAAQRLLIERMDQAFLVVPAKEWRDPRNARAAIIHLLSGGRPDVTHALVERGHLTVIDERIVSGGLAYVEGREAEARAALADVDPLALEPSIGGHIALVRAALELSIDPQRSIALLDQARLLLPGTLVEEAALRREVFVAGSVGDAEKFQNLAMHYLRRYRNSIYASDFRRRFTAAVRSFGFATEPAQFPLMESLFAEFDADTRRQLYLLSAYASLIEGRLTVARKAAERARTLAAADTQDQSRAMLYQAAASLDAERLPDALEMLWALDRTVLDGGDRALADAAMAALNGIRFWPQDDGKEVVDITAGRVSATPPAADSRLPIMERASRAIEVADVLLAREEKRP